MPIQEDCQDFLLTVISCQSLEPSLEYLHTATPNNQTNPPMKQPLWSTGKNNVHLLVIIVISLDL